MLGLTILVVGFVVSGLFFQRLASPKDTLRDSPTVAAIVPANTTGLVVKKANTVSFDKNGKVSGVNNDGGGVVNLIHAVPGHRVNRRDHDQMNWFMEKGREWRPGFYFWAFDIQFIGPLRYIRINDVRTFRWGRKDDEDKYHMMAKSQPLRYAFFSGQHDIQQDHVETKAIVKFNLRLNITLEEKYPVRVRLKNPDSYAVLTMIVNDHIINQIGDADPQQFIGDDEITIPDKKEREKAKESLKKELIASFADIRELIETETGIAIKNVALPDFDFDEETRKLLERKTKAILDAEANLIEANNEAEQEIARARGRKEAQLLINAGDANRVENVLIPASTTPERVSVFNTDRGAAALEKNQTLTTLVMGAGAVPTIPVGNNK